MATHSSNEHSYILDPESPTEMARLINFDRITTKAMGGPLAEQLPSTIDAMQETLDLACGPGGWVLDVAFDYPHLKVTGVDISTTMINYADARARTQHLTNASFAVEDITRPMDFSDETFDLINARFLNGVLRREAWQPFIKECTRILRPGGILRLTEMVDTGVSTSPAFERMHALLCQTMGRVGYGFSPDGQSLGITPMLPRFLRDAGYQDIRAAAHVLDFSVDTDAWLDFYRNVEVGYEMAKPLFVKLGVTTQEDIERVYQQMLIEMRAETFCGMWHFVTVWGYKRE